MTPHRPVQIRNPERALAVLFLVPLLCSCAAFGTKTVFSAREKSAVGNLGFSRLEDDALWEEKFKGISELFRSTMVEALNEYEGENNKSLDQAISFDDPDADLVARLCKENELDGIVLTRLWFIHATITEALDADVQVKLIGRTGRVLVIARHNTRLGNSYFWFPAVETVVRDGIRGALARLMEESGKKKR